MTRLTEVERDNNELKYQCRNHEIQIADEEKNKQKLGKNIEHWEQAFKADLDRYKESAE